MRTGKGSAPLPPNDKKAWTRLCSGRVGVTTVTPLAHMTGCDLGPGRSAAERGGASGQRLAHRDEIDGDAVQVVDDGLVRDIAGRPVELQARPRGHQLERAEAGRLRLGLAESSSARPSPRPRPVGMDEEGADAGGLGRGVEPSLRWPRDTRRRRTGPCADSSRRRRSARPRARPGSRSRPRSGRCRRRRRPSAPPRPVRARSRRATGRGRSARSARPGAGASSIRARRKAKGGAASVIVPS